MRNRFMKGLLSAVLILATSLSQSQGRITDTSRLEKKISILNDKVFFLFPHHSVNIARPTDIMSADPNQNLETRIVTDFGNMRLVFFARELFAFADKDLLGTLKKEKGDTYGFKRKTLGEKPLLHILSTPTRFDTSRKSILINSLLVKTEDNTLFRIDALINPAAFAYKDEFIELSEKVFKTLMPGTRLVNLEAREESFPIAGTKTHFVLNVPENYYVTEDKKYDFQVYKFNKYKNLSDTSITNITLYAGFHPSYFYKSYGFPETSKKKLQGIFLGESIEWMLFADGPRFFYLKEQMSAGGTIREGLLFHVAMISNRENLMPELSKIVEAIKLVEK